MSARQTGRASLSSGAGTHLQGEIEEKRLRAERLRSRKSVANLSQFSRAAMAAAAASASASASTSPLPAHPPAASVTPPASATIHAPPAAQAHAPELPHIAASLPSGADEYAMLLAQISQMAQASIPAGSTLSHRHARTISMPPQMIAQALLQQQQQQAQAQAQAQALAQAQSKGPLAPSSLSPPLPPFAPYSPPHSPAIGKTDEGQKKEQPRRMPQLTVEIEAVVDIPPVVTYDREIQTDPYEPAQAAQTGEAQAAEGQQQQQQQPQPEAPQEMPVVEAKGVLVQQAAASTQQQQQQQLQQQEMSREEAERVIASETFGQFLSRTSRILERAMCLPDVTVDFSAQDEVDDTKNQDSHGLEHKVKLYDDNWCRNRVVTDLAWNPKHQDLLLAAYSAAPGIAEEDQEGVALLWSPLLPTRPEYVLTCQSTVTSAIFSPVSRGSTMVIGGTKSGHVVMWDTRAGRRPVAQAAPSQATHTYPVYCLAACAQSSQSTTLTSLSSDGRMCIWSLGAPLLAQPLETYDVPGDTRAMGATAMAPLPHSPNKYLIGTENGLVLTFHAHNKMPGSCEKVFEAHEGPVLSIDCHPDSATEGAPAQTELRSELSQSFLTCSADWTARLWRGPAPTSLVQQSQTQSRLIRTFGDGGDYVYDVRWSPTQSGVFARVDGSGVVSLWDLSCGATEEPQARARTGQVPLSRLRWSSDGRQIAAGDAAGTVHILSASLKSTTPADGSGWAWLSKALSDTTTTPMNPPQQE